MKAASEEDWKTEYLAPILSIKIVSGLEEAIDHINEHSSQHTESIMTEDHEHAQRFLREVDSSSVMINACLLYTSPSPRDQRGSRMPSSA